MDESQVNTILSKLSSIEKVLEDLTHRSERIEGQIMVLKELLPVQEPRSPVGMVRRNKPVPKAPRKITLTPYKKSVIIEGEIIKYDEEIRNCLKDHQARWNSVLRGWIIKPENTSGCILSLNEKFRDLSITQNELSPTPSKPKIKPPSLSSESETESETVA